MNQIKEKKRHNPKKKKLRDKFYLMRLLVKEKIKFNL